MSNSIRYNQTLTAEYYNTLAAIGKVLGYKGVPEVCKAILYERIYNEAFILPLQIKAIKVYPSALKSICFSLTISEEAAQILDKTAKKLGFQTPAEYVRDVIRAKFLENPVLFSTEAFNNL